MSNITLRQNLLTYIAYCLPRSAKGETGRFFSYEQCQKDLESIDIETTIPTLRKEFSLAKSQGLIEFKTYYRQPYPVLTAKGRLEIKTKLPFRRYGDFEETWKIVIFDIPETRRKDRLRLHLILTKLGFGRLGRGVYISSHALFNLVKRSIRQLGLEEYVTFLKTKTIEEEKKTIIRAWDLKKLNNQYEKFIQKARVASFMKKPFWPLLAKKLEKEFARLYGQDPQLPEKFLLPNWQGKQAYNIFKALSNSY